MSRSRGPAITALLSVLLGATGAALALPANFSETVVFDGLTQPTAVRFSPDGRVFVAEKSGLIKVFDGLDGTTPTVVADLTANVQDFWDRGLLGFALDPAFPVRPYIYVLYTYDYDPLDPSRPAPRWGDTCPDKDAAGNVIGPGAATDGCVVNGRLSRLTVNPDNTLAGGEQVLLENNWCQQFPSHSIGSLVFGPEGALYVSAGDGASFNSADWGQFGGTRGAPPYTPANPCADPNRPRGTAAVRPGAEGGALRAQDVRTAGDATSFDGTVLRIDPDTGAAWPTNPLVGDAAPDNDPIIAYGLRNPFRITTRPGTREIWIGDVGWNTWEEIDRIPDPDAVVENFGWPCVEGPAFQNLGYNLGVALCNLPIASTTAPYDQYAHNIRLYNGDPCVAANGSSISGLAFYDGGTYPPDYQGALFFADYSRSCVWVTRAGADGNPDPATRTAFLTAASDAQQVGDPRPVDLEIGPGGDLFLVDFGAGQVRRVTYNAVNTPPSAVIHAAPLDGPAPLTVEFDGTGSSDPDPGATIYYAWDLDGDGQYDDGSLAGATWTYDQPGTYTARLRVTDDHGATSVAEVTISAGNSAPEAIIDTPAPTLTWRVGDVVGFSGHGDDVNDGLLGAAAMRWDIVLHHCESGPGTCHDHPIESLVGAASGSFTAPDHEYYSELVFTLTVTDSGGLTGSKSLTLAPVLVTNSFVSSPPGLLLSAAGFEAPAPFERPTIVGSTNEIAAPTPQDLGGVRYRFVSWDDGGEADHTFTAGDAPRVCQATFAACAAAETACDGVDEDCDGIVDDVAPPRGAPDLTIDIDGLAWSALSGADAYDIVRGHFAAGGGSPFTAATTDLCVASGDSGTSLPYADNPGVGEAWWFVIRARDCGGAGSYDEGDAAQALSRDAAIDASSAACP